MADSFVSQWHQLFEGCESYLSYYNPTPSPSLDPSLTIPPQFHLNNFYKQADSLSSKYSQSITSSSTHYQTHQSQDIPHLGRL
jgi:hypothetical protein